MPADFRVSIVNAPGADAYPISTYTWMLIPEKMNDKRKAAALTKFLHWALTDGQKYDAPLEYAPLPETVVKAELQQLKELDY
jgi:phosphate transport system substrate-binding protein